MQTTDTGLLFQTDQQLSAAENHARKSQAAEKVGDPIRVQGKVLDFDILGQDAWLAESGWQARRLDLLSGRTKQLYKGHKGPVTSLALRQIATSSETPWLALFTGSWDKSIRIWDADSGELKFTLEGHADFVKSLTIIDLPSPMLLSTSSDRTCRLWNLSKLESNTIPNSIQIIKDHTRPIECAAWRSVSEGEDMAGATLVWTGDSMGVVKEWIMKSDGLRYLRDIQGHETSVSQMAVTDEGLWTVSMDYHAIFHPFREENRIILPHPRYVKSILPLTAQISGSIVLTGSEDEDIRVWDEGGVLLATVQGHCGEVTRLRTWVKHEAGKPRDLLVVSSGLDGTLRRWSIPELLNPIPLNYDPVLTPEESTGMTAEEERELEDLLE